MDDSESAKLERLQQECHELKKQLHVQEAVVSEASEQVDVLQAMLNQQAENAEQALNTVKKQLKEEVSRWKDKVMNLEELIQNNEAEYQKSVAQLKMQLSNAEQAKEESCSSVLMKEVDSLKEQNENLKASLMKLQDEFTLLQKENMQMQKLYEEATEGKVNLTCILESKKEELTSTLNCLEELREEFASLKHSYDMLKVLPAQDVVKKKGNSVFAEVEDNRQAMKASLDALNQKYKKLKQSYQMKCAIESKVMAEKVALCKVLEERGNAECDCDPQLLNGYKRRVNDLELALQQARKEADASFKVVTNDYEGFGIVESMLQTKKEEMKLLREQLDEHSLSLLMQNELLFKMRRDLQMVRAQYARAQAEVDKLKNEATVREQ